MSILSRLKNFFNQKNKKNVRFIPGFQGNDREPVESPLALGLCVCVCVCAGHKRHVERRPGVQAADPVGGRPEATRQAWLQQRERHRGHRGGQARGGALCQHAPRSRRSALGS